MGGTSGAYMYYIIITTLTSDLDKPTFLLAIGLGGGSGFEPDRENSSASVGMSIGSSWTMEPVDNALTLPLGARHSSALGEESSCSLAFNARRSGFYSPS